MTLSIVVTLVLVLFFWTASAHYEWNVPLDWQILIRAWKERLCNDSQCVTFVLELDSENGETENHLWLLKRALPSLQKSYKHPFRIEVQINSNLALGQNERYIVSLQRRFLDINILGSLNEENSI